MSRIQDPRRYNAAEDFVDRHLGEGRSDKPAFVDRTRSLSYGQLDAETRRMANLLVDHGLEREQRVGLLLLDTVDFPVAFWGAIRAGVVPVAMNTLLGEDQYRYILDDSRARALFVSSALLPRVEPILHELSHLRHVFVVGGDGVAEDAVDAAGGLRRAAFAPALARASARFETVDTIADEVAFWLYSSGSTGTPKGVQHLHSSLQATHRTYGASVLGVREDDVVFSAAKLFFAYGLGAGMTFPMAVGATTVLLDARPTPEAVFAVLAERSPTLFFGVPTLYAALLAEGVGEGGRASSRLRLCVSAGEALPEELGRRWQERMGVEVLDGVGSTEMLHIFLSNRPGDVVYGTSGVPVPGFALRLVDEAGAEVEPGEVGELLVRGDSAAVGYWGQREKSRRTFEGEWTRTGDKYVRDEAGRYTYQGRTDDMFKVSGIWVSPFEVESALVAHEAVLEAAVVPYEDDERLLRPRAFVVKAASAPDDGPLVGSLQAFVKERIGRWKYPREVVFVDALPKTATGKVKRFELRARGATPAGPPRS